MKKTIPIAIEKYVPMKYKFIEWKIHNVCTYDCSFCGDNHKDGSQRWFSLEKYKEYADKIIESCNGMPFWIQFTGGEPTLYPDLLELMQYFKQKGGWISIITNGTRSLRWWEEAKKMQVIDFLQITYHSEQTSNYKHISDIITLFHDEPVDVVCLITHVENTVELAFEAFSYIQKNTGAKITVKAMFISEYNIYEKYTNNQLNKLKLLNNISGRLHSTKKKLNIPAEMAYSQKLRIIYDDGAVTTSNPQTLMKNQQTNFLGWSCDVGINTMRIEYDTIFRGVCSAGGEQAKISQDKINFADTPLICDKNLCFCGTDIIANKKMV